MFYSWIPFRNPVVAALVHLAAALFLLETVLLLVGGYRVPYPFWQRVLVTAVCYASALDMWRRTPWFRRWRAAVEASENARQASRPD